MLVRDWIVCIVGGVIAGGLCLFLGETIWSPIVELVRDAPASLAVFVIMVFALGLIVGYILGQTIGKHRFDKAKEKLGMTVEEAAEQLKDPRSAYTLEEKIARAKMLPEKPRAILHAIYHAFAPLATKDIAKEVPDPEQTLRMLCGFGLVESKVSETGETVLWDLAPDFRNHLSTDDDLVGLLWDGKDDFDKDDWLRRVRQLKKRLDKATRVEQLLVLYLYEVDDNLTLSQGLYVNIWDEGMFSYTEMDDGTRCYRLNPSFKEELEECFLDPVEYYPISEEGAEEDESLTVSILEAMDCYYVKTETELREKYEEYRAGIKKAKKERNDEWEHEDLHDLVGQRRGHS